MRVYHSYAIEVFDEPAGVVVQHGAGYKFFASTQRYHALDGRVFCNPVVAEQAARRLAGQSGDRTRH